MGSINKVLFLNLLILLYFLFSIVASQPYFVPEVKILTKLNLIASPVMDDFLVNDDTGTFKQCVPAIAADDSGNFVIIWEDDRDGSKYAYVQRYGSSGIPWGNNFRVYADSGTLRQLAPAIAMNGSGDFILTWTNVKYSSHEIYAQRYNYLGLPLDSNFIVIDSWGAEEAPSVAMNDSGNFVVTWTFVGINISEVYARRFDYQGLPLDSSFRVNADTYYFESGHDYSAVVMNGSGDFIITWEDYRNFQNWFWDIFAQRYDSSGATLGYNFKVNDDTLAVNQWTPAIAGDSFGNFVISWADGRNSNLDIYAQRYSHSGIPLGSNIRVNDDVGTSEQSSPAIAMGDSGNFIIVWEDSRNGNLDIYAQRYDSSGNPSGSNFLVPSPQSASFSQENPSVAINGFNIYFVWQDNRRGNWDIYAKIVNWDWTDVGDEQNAGLPNRFELAQNYPNPFNPTTTIPFKAGSGEHIARSPIHTTLIIYNILGQKVRMLVDEERLPGNYSVIWDGKDYSGKEVTSGIYFYQLKTKDFTDTKKMVLLR